MTLVKWDPFGELTALQNSISRLFNENYGKPSERGILPGQRFPVDIKDTPEAVIVKAELPGFDREDIKVSFNSNLLTISGERKREEEEEGTDFVRVERSYGTFSRSFTVDMAVKEEDIKARYQNGLLEIIIPKDEKSKPQGIDIEIE